jgi:hypothetical protein
VYETSIYFWLQTRAAVVAAAEPLIQLNSSAAEEKNSLIPNESRNKRRRTLLHSEKRF